MKSDTSSAQITMTLVEKASPRVKDYQKEARKRRLRKAQFIKNKLHSTNLLGEENLNRVRLSVGLHLNQHLVKHPSDLHS